MSVEILRRAANMMRERAEAATPGAWEAVGFTVRHESGKGIAASHNADEPNAAHIASWHPAVALAVAVWLVSVADDQNVDFDLINSEGYCALTVARAYLGESA